MFFLEPRLHPPNQLKYPALNGHWEKLRANIGMLKYLSRLVASLLITGGSFSSDFERFQGLKIGVASGCLGETSIFKIIMIDDVTLWSKLKSTW